MTITTTQLIEQLQWRYAVKKFDDSRRLSDETWSALEQSLILSPSSYGLQPWKFLVITDPTVKEKLPEISWNQSQPKDCSHMVVLAVRKKMDREYIDRYMDTVIQVRALESDSMDGYRKVLTSTVENLENHLDWNARQVYIALGQLMVAAAMLGVDTCPMEGINLQAYDRVLQLEDTDYTTLVGCAVGYRHPDDSQSQAKKVRFDREELIISI